MEPESTEDTVPKTVPPSSGSKLSTVRNLTAFWIFGLCNNFAYVIMLSAAHDILKTQQNVTAATPHSAHNGSESRNSSVRECNTLSTGAVLLADILPAVLIKLTAPFYILRVPYGTRIVLVVGAQIASYLIVSFSSGVAMSLAGVCFASISSGLGEITFLSIAAHFDKNVISTWSSGTGGAGIFGALAYAGLTEPKLGNLSPRTTLQIMLVVPAVMALAYRFLVEIPPTVHRVNILKPRTWLVPTQRQQNASNARNDYGTVSSSLEYMPLPVDEFDDVDEVESDQLLTPSISDLTVGQKLHLVLPLLKYMIPLGLVYIGEYFINQGLQEMVYFQSGPAGLYLSHESQYRWYQVLYQLGVFASRSSVNLIQIKSSLLPLLPILQFINVGIFFFEAYLLFMPSILIVFALIIFEGLLGGAAYVNTFYQIRQEIDSRYVEFSLGVASLADSSGIVIAGLTSIPIHNWVCSLPMPSRHY